MSLAAAGSNLHIHTYRGNSEISFFSDDQAGLSVTIDTEHLHIRSIEATEDEYNRYADLFGNRDVMEKFATGQTKTREEIKTRINAVWVKRWHECDPYSGFAVFKKGTNEFLGHVVLGHGDRPGVTELAGLGYQSFWDKGYGSEAATAMVREYAPATVQEGYLLDGKPLERIIATARPDNPASGRILEKTGMQLVRKEEKYGAMRHHYAILLNAIQMQPSKKAANSWCTLL